ncbi:MAG: hypothetical protein GC159_02095 [Phycisphaera sp.]|nr:hypothetical protein [Phycisphaera sp.]
MRGSLHILLARRVGFATVVTLLALMSMSLGGCAEPGRGATTHRTAKESPDATAQRLHELCEYILMYYARHRALPPSMDALVADEPEADALLQRTGETLVYHADPRHVPGRPGMLLIHDTAATRDGVWTIFVEPQQRSGQLAVQVLQISERELKAVMGPAALGR